MMKTDADLIILGGGCAGLSLAMRLADLGEHAPRTIILESRSEYVHDRTWCFWGGPDAEMGELVSHQWHDFAISTPTERIVRRSEARPYQMIPSDAFYSAAQRKIAQTDRIELLLGTTVTSQPIQSKGKAHGCAEKELWSLHYEKGPNGHGGERHALSAPWIVDTRPKQLCGLSEASRLNGETQPHLWQSFLGSEIMTTDACFDPACAELMDFSLMTSSVTSSPPQILFLYLLPLAENRVIIEATVFDRDRVSAHELEEPLQRMIKKRLGAASFTMLRSEHGILPMGTNLTPTTTAAPLATSRAAAGLVHAGLTAGGARPSTGYAFQRIQRWAKACAESLGKGRGPIRHAPDAFIPCAMDALFLRVLDSHPELAPDLFLSLFKKVDPVRIVRFMSDQGHLSDYASIITALPPAPFLKALAHALFRNPSSKECTIRNKS